MNLQAIGTRVIVKMDPREQETGGIFIPDAYLQREVLGTVASTGEYVELVEPGDRVLLRYSAGVELMIDKHEYTLITEDDILARIDDTDEPSN